MNLLRPASRTPAGPSRTRQAAARLRAALRPCLLRARRAWRRWAAAAALALPSALLAQPASERVCPPAVPPPTAEQVKAAAESAVDRGFLWRLRRDGHESYLHGTVHVGKLEWAFAGPRTKAAWQASDTLALEIDVSDPEVRAQSQRRKPGPPVVLPAALQERLLRQMDAACVPREALAALHPVMQAVALTVLAARWVGLDPGYAQEALLASSAHAIQRPIVSLESVELQQQALVPEQPVSASLVVEQSLEQLEEGRVQSVLARMARAWERGDLRELETYPQWCDCVRSESERAGLTRMNDARNPHLAERIAALHGEGKRVFAAVGALHMTGPMSLPRLLAERGFTVERIEF